MDTESLSFAAIERRIQAMPDGPSAVLTTPRWLTWLNLVGAAGVARVSEAHPGLAA